MELEYVALNIKVLAENFQEKGTVYLSIARGKSRLSHKKHTTFYSIILMILRMCGNIITLLKGEYYNV